MPTHLHQVLQDAVSDPAPRVAGASSSTSPEPNLRFFVQVSGIRSSREWWWSRTAEAAKVRHATASRVKNNTWTTRSNGLDSSNRFEVPLFRLEIIAFLVSLCR
jgi:hypothetical protein